MFDEFTVFPSTHSTENGNLSSKASPTTLEFLYIVKTFLMVLTLALFLLTWLKQVLNLVQNLSDQAFFFFHCDVRFDVITKHDNGKQEKHV